MIIRELARALAVRPSTLRFYERIGMPFPAGRVSGRREYDTEEEQRLAFILSARDSGFALKEIKGLEINGLISTAAQGISPRRLAPNAPILFYRHGLPHRLGRALAGGR
ncbi:MAG TPA: MerR family transcriptional regulator [Chthoniobacterales bacterium]